LRSLFDRLGCGHDAKSSRRNGYPKPTLTQQSADGRVSVQVTAPMPRRHKIFLWLVSGRGRLNTRDNMVRKCWVTDAGCEL
jgi:hypothetical protein